MGWMTIVSTIINVIHVLYANYSLFVVHGWSVFLGRLGDSVGCNALPQPEVDISPRLHLYVPQDARRPARLRPHRNVDRAGVVVEILFRALPGEGEHNVWQLCYEAAALDVSQVFVCLVPQGPTQMHAGDLHGPS